MRGRAVSHIDNIPQKICKSKIYLLLGSGGQYSLILPLNGRSKKFWLNLNIYRLENSIEGVTNAMVARRESVIKCEVKYIFSRC